MGAYKKAPIVNSFNINQHYVLCKRVDLKKKIRIMFVTLQLDAGGSERVVYDLARGLDPDRFEIFITTFKSGVLEKFLRAVCKEVYIINKKDGFDPSAMKRMATIVKKNNIDIVNTHHYMPCFYSFFGTKMVNYRRLVYTEHSVKEVQDIAGSLHANALYWMLFKMNAVVGVSREIAQEFRKMYPRHERKIYEILNAIDIQRFNGRKNKTKIRSMWGFNNDQFVVGMVANFRRIKNHKCLLRAAARLKDSCPKLKLLFVGTGFADDLENSEDEIKRLIYELCLQGRVVLAGYQEDIPQLLTAIDLFCLPSYSEGMPVSILEAMAANIPVICSNVSGIREVVEHGQTGFLFPSNDDEALSLELKAIIDNPIIAKHISEKAFKHVNSAHDSKLWIQKYTTLFEGLTST